MGNELLTEDQVKEQLGISDFRSIKKEQLIEFVSAIPQMDKEVAKACVAQFPHFKDYSNAIVSHFYELCDAAIRDDSNASVECYTKILDELRVQLNKPLVFGKRKEYIIEKMVEVGEHVQIVEENKQEHKRTVLKIAGTVGVAALSAGAAILGVKISKK